MLPAVTLGSVFQAQQFEVLTSTGDKVATL